MRIPAVFLLSFLCIALLLAAGCTQTSFGTRAPVGFGAGAEDQQIIDCLKAKYGESCGDGPPRFVEPVVATQLNERNMPMDSVVKLNKNAKKMYFWVFFDRFQPKDPVTLSMKYLPTNKVVDSVEKTPDGNCGAIRAEYLMPDGGWPVGRYEITISGRGVSATKTFELVSGDTVTVPLPYSKEMCNSQHDGAITQTTTTTPYVTTQPSGTLQVVTPTLTQNSTLPDVSMAPSAWTGCWNVDTSPCGPTQLQLKPRSDGTSVFGYWCDYSKWLSASSVNIPLRGSWYTPQGGRNCCTSGPRGYYCDPVCQLLDQYYNPSGNFGPFEFSYVTDSRSLEGKWGNQGDNLTSAGHILHGTATACTSELVLENSVGTGVSPTQTVVVVQPGQADQMGSTGR